MIKINDDIIYNSIKLIYECFGYNPDNIHIVSSIALYLQGIIYEREYKDIDIVIDDFNYNRLEKTKYLNYLRNHNINLLLDIIDDKERPIIPDYKQIQFRDLIVSVQSPEKILNHKKLVLESNINKLNYQISLLNNLNSHINFYTSNNYDNIYKYCKYIKEIFNKDFVICGNYALLLQNVIIDKNYDKRFEIYFIGEHYKSIIDDKKRECSKNILKDKFNDNVEFIISSKIIKGIDEDYYTIKLNDIEINIETLSNIELKLKNLISNLTKKCNKHQNDIIYLEKILNKN